MTITPAEALRLSRATTLADRHGTAVPSVAEWHFTLLELVALLDDAVTPKDATIKALREEMQQMEREFQREAREIAAQAASDARAERGDYF